MQILRTRSYELAEIPAIAYRQKLPSGGAGVKIIRLDVNASASATLDKRTGEPVPYGTYDETLFPLEAFYEAMEMTSGLPYTMRKPINIAACGDAAEPKADAEGAAEAVSDMSAGFPEEEYNAIVERYSDEKGRMNYTLMNKDFIQFASKSKTVADMISKKSQTEDILVFIVQSRSAFIAGKKNSVSSEEAKALILVLDELDPRSAFKELKQFINRKLMK